MKRCVAIQHVAFENLGVFVQPIEEAGYAISYVQAGVVPMEPELWKDADLAVVLGGPIGVYQDDLYPFLAEEKALVAGRLASGRRLAHRRQHRVSAVAGRTRHARSRA